jgi:hypothetical protein
MSRIRAVKGAPTTQTVKIGRPSTTHQNRCSSEYQFMLVSILAFWDPSSMSIHLKILRLSSANFGWRKNIMLTNEMIQHLLKSGAHFGLIILTANHIIPTTIVMNMGMMAVRKILKISLDGKDPLIS